MSICYQSMLLLITTLLGTTFVAWSNACPTGCEDLASFSCTCFGVEMQAPPSGDHFGYTTLSLAKNGISSLEQGSLKNYPNLTSFFLLDNPIKVLDLRIFTEIREIGDIEVSYCDLERIIPLDEGQTLRKLSSLVLSNNKLTTLPDDFLRGILGKKLILKLDGNPLEFSGEKPFLKSEKLYALDISNTDASGITDQTLSALPALKQLFAGNCNIADASFKFTSLRRLQELYLQENPIKEIKQGFLAEKQNLRIILLRNTPLENVEVAAVEGRTKQVHLIISNTPYGCQCKHESIMPYFREVSDGCRGRYEYCPFNKPSRVTN